MSQELNSNLSYALSLLDRNSVGQLQVFAKRQVEASTPVNADTKPRLLNRLSDSIPINQIDGLIDATEYIVSGLKMQDLVELRTLVDSARTELINDGQDSCLRPLDTFNGVLFCMQLIQAQAIRL